MPESTKSAPKDFMGFLEYYLVTKAPFQLPTGVKEFIVKFGPWITLVLLVLAVPPLLLALGLSTAFIPFATVGGVYGFGLATLVLLVQLVLEVMALPGLFARKMSGWTLLFYSEVVSVAYGVLSGSFISSLIGALIGFYILFQIKALYTK